MRPAASCLIASLAGCALPVDGPARPRLDPEERVALAMRRWGDALRAGDGAALADAEDRSGQAAFVYVGLKAAASPAPGGAQAVEQTAMMMVLLPLLQSLWPGVFGPVQDTFPVYLPGDRGHVMVSRTQTIGRLEEAAAAHRQRLRARRAWTCRPDRVVRTVPRDEPALQRAAALSTTIFAGWLEDVEALWLVEAACAGGPGLFVVTARADGDDRVLLATLPGR